MAIGFSPKHVQSFPLDNQDSNNFLVFAIETATKLGWNVSFVSRSGLIAFTKFSFSSWSEEVKVTIEGGIATIKSECAGNQLIDWGKNKKNVVAFIETFEEVNRYLSPEEFNTKLAELHQRFATVEDDILSKPPASMKEKITSLADMFRPTNGYFISPILIDINILLFIVMVVFGVHFIEPENQNLLDWGANFRPLTLSGQWWRLLSSCFLHIGIFHLLLNMYALIYIGVLLEPYLGKVRFLAAYLISGVAASVTSLWWNDLTISAGASGAIFGMYGVFLALLTTNTLDKSARKSLLTSIIIFVAYNIMNGLKPDSGIDNAAHIGGLLSGLVIGYSFVPSLRQEEKKSLTFSTIGALATALLLTSITVYRSIPNDIGEYDKVMNEFFTLEAKALEIYNMPDGTANDELLLQLKDNGIYLWEDCLELLESVEPLDLPEGLKYRNSKLREYCELRKKSYLLIYKAINEQTNYYDMEINSLNLAIEEIINELSQS